MEGRRPLVLTKFPTDEGESHSRLVWIERFLSWRADETVRSGPSCCSVCRQAQPRNCNRPSFFSPHRGQTSCQAN
ncbi:unnamed protein product [Protopolystoma xenopodis]|uniref:Uncharacterized protein n=1 Tax=Protopolystoma xenopodis TaxID=117903 RepID=A0A448WFR3_9PLAT|nr:unnamed protein product [Protopolystoma xenopodis]